MMVAVSQERLLAYVLGQARAEEARELARYLQERPEAAARVRDYFDCFMALTMQLEPERLPDGAEASLLKQLHVRGAAAALLEDEGEPAADEPARVASPEMAPPAVASAGAGNLEEEVSIDPSEPPAAPPVRRRSPAWLFVLLALAVLAAAVWYALPLLRPSDAPPEQPAASNLEAFAATPGAVVHPLADTDGFSVGTLVLLPDRLLMAMDFPPPEGQVYQAWEFVDGVPASLGVTDEREMLLEHEVAPGSLFGVTLEPVGGSDTPSGAPVASADL